MSRPLSTMPRTCSSSSRSVCWISNSSQLPSRWRRRALDDVGPSGPTVDAARRRRSAAARSVGLQEQVEPAALDVVDAVAEHPLDRGALVGDTPSASSTVIRSLECATSERKRASLWRRWRSSASDAPSTASETWERQRLERSSISSRVSAGRTSDDEQARRPPDGERQERARQCAGRATQRLPQSLGEQRPAGCRLDLAACRQPVGRDVVGERPLAAPSDEAATHCGVVLAEQRRAAPAARRRRDAWTAERRRRSIWSVLGCADQLDAGAAQGALAGDGPLLLAHEARHAGDHEQEQTQPRRR